MPVPDTEVPHHWQKRNEIPITLPQIAPHDMPVQERLFQLYLFDMSEFAGWSVADDGRFVYPDSLLTPYFSQGDHYPYFIVINGKLAGFSLVRRLPQSDQIWDMGQFFVRRKHRRTGAGHAALAASVAKHPGQ